MFVVYLVDEFNGNSYWRYEHKDRFSCEVWVQLHEYDAPNKCHYEIEEV